MITGENTRQEDVPEGAWFLPFLSEAGQTDLRRICGTNMKQEFYYQQMNKAQQNAYRAMLDGFESLSPEFPVLRLDGKELSDIFFRLRHILCGGLSLQVCPEFRVCTDDSGIYV